MNGSFTASRGHRAGVAAVAQLVARLGGDHQDGDVGRAGLAPLLALCGGYFMVILDVTIVNVAAPAIGRDLSASLTDVQWIVDGYTIAFAGLLLLGGALGDRWGHRRVFCVGVGVFTAASLGCALAPDENLLTVLRIVEGVGAASLVPGSLALLQQVYASSEARAWAFERYRRAMSKAQRC